MALERELCLSHAWHSIRPLQLQTSMGLYPCANPPSPMTSLTTWSRQFQIPGLGTELHPEVGVTVCDFDSKNLALPARFDEEGARVGVVSSGSADATPSHGRRAKDLRCASLAHHPIEYRVTLGHCHPKRQIRDFG